jgi:hypothetical protein
MKTTYYIITPNGRSKLSPNPKTDEEAIEAFRNHWTAKVTWTAGKQRVLVKETKEHILVEDITTTLGG